MAKRRLKSLESKKEAQAHSPVSRPEDEAKIKDDAEDGEIEGGELEESAVAPTTTGHSDNQPSNSDKNEKKDKENGKRIFSKVERRAHKRKRAEQDQGSQDNKKKKKGGRGKNKRERSPPADRNWIGQRR
jgi:hypothetical protein